MSFEVFWQRYPRRKCKKAARDKYEKALKIATHEEIMAGVERYRADIARKGTEEQFVAHAATWLHNERWEDEYGLDVESDPTAGFSPTLRRHMQEWNDGTSREFCETSGDDTDHRTAGGHGLPAATAPSTTRRH